MAEPKDMDGARQWTQRWVNAQHGGNMSAAARAAGVTLPALSDFLRGRRGAGMKLLRGIATAAGTTVDVIVGPALAEDSTALHRQFLAARHDAPIAAVVESPDDYDDEVDDLTEFLSDTLGDVEREVRIAALADHTETLSTTELVLTRGRITAAEVRDADLYLGRLFRLALDAAPAFLRRRWVMRAIDHSSRIYFGTPAGPADSPERRSEGTMRRSLMSHQLNDARIERVPVPLVLAAHDSWRANTDDRWQHAAALIAAIGIELPAVATLADEWAREPPLGDQPTLMPSPTPRRPDGTKEE